MTPRSPALSRRQPCWEVVIMPETLFVLSRNQLFSMRGVVSRVLWRLLPGPVSAAGAAGAVAWASVAATRPVSTAAAKHRWCFGTATRALSTESGTTDPARGDTDCERSITNLHRARARARPPARPPRGAHVGRVHRRSVAAAMSMFTNPPAFSLRVSVSLHS